MLKKMQGVINLKRFQTFNNQIRYTTNTYVIIAKLIHLTTINQPVYTQLRQVICSYD